jgi:hypothetical protein
MEQTTMQKHRKIKNCLIVLVIYLVALPLLPNLVTAQEEIIVDSYLGFKGKSQITGIERK